MRHLFNIIDDTHYTCLQSYQRIAESLMNDYKLQVRNKFYRIIECEFYYYTSRHEDPYVHGHPMQKESCGEWYFHGSGLDITLANGENYGGILLRGIAEVTSDKANPRRNDAIIGPLKVCTEIFKQIGSVSASKALEFGLVDISTDPMGANMKTAQVFSIPRIGLNPLKDPEESFVQRPYRFVTFLHLPHKDAEKIKKYLTKDADQPLSTELYQQYYTQKKW